MYRYDSTNIDNDSKNDADNSNDTNQINLNDKALSGSDSPGCGSKDQTRPTRNMNHTLTGIIVIKTQPADVFKMEQASLYPPLIKSGLLENRSVLYRGFFQL